MPIILVATEATKDDKYNWDDSIGERHHYPNGYVNKIISDRKFIYYKTRLRKGGKTGVAGYFGYGSIGDIYLDPKTIDEPKRRRHWYCEIRDYNEFKNIVPARDNGIGIFEDITNNRNWGEIREISENKFDKIISYASERYGIKASKDYKGDDYSFDNKTPVQSDGLIFIRKDRDKKSKNHLGYFRKSHESKKIGDLGEKIVLNRILMQKQNSGDLSELEHVASQNKGYDIQYRDKNGNLVGIEVKATKMAQFHNIHITSNEWETAKEMGNNYHLYLVADCKNKNPKFHIIINPVHYINEGNGLLIPLDYKIEFN